MASLLNIGRHTSLLFRRRIVAKLVFQSTRNMSHIIDVGIVFKDKRVSQVKLLMVGLHPSIVDVVLSSPAPGVSDFVDLRRAVTERTVKLIIIIMNTKLNILVLIAIVYLMKTNKKDHKYV